jgi:hypothetical protein
MLDIKGQLPLMGEITHPTGDKYVTRSALLGKSRIPKTWWQYSVFDAGSPGINELVGPACAGVLTGQLTPAAGAKSIQDGISSWYKPA